MPQVSEIAATVVRMLGGHRPVSHHLVSTRTTVLSADICQICGQRGHRSIDCHRGMAART